LLFNGRGWCASFVLLLDLNLHLADRSGRGCLNANLFEFGGLLLQLLCIFQEPLTVAV
jgi:hypothetical protein